VTGNDWIELHNESPNDAANLTGYVLHDDKVPLDGDAFTFTAQLDIVVLEPQQYLLLCTNGAPGTTPQFGIGGSDTVTLLDDQGMLVSSVGPLPGLSYSGLLDVTYAWSGGESDSTYGYTTTPTPGQPNVLTPPEGDIKEQLARQNAEGARFFGMDERGYPVADGFASVLDFDLT